MLRSAMRRAAVAALVGGVAALATPGAMAFNLNGYLRPKGEGDVSFSYSSSSYDQFWAGTTKVSNTGLGEVTNQSVSVWAAYGITDRLTLFASLPYVDSEGDGTAGFQESGLQDFSAVVAYRFASVGSKVRNEFVGGLGLTTPASNYEADLPVSIGDGTTDGLFRFIYQLNWEGLYFSQQIGFNLRGGDAPNDFPFFTELGYTFGRVTVSGFFEKLVAHDGTDIGDPGFTFPSNREEYERTGAKVYIRITDKYGISLFGAGTLNGRNTGDSSGAAAGFTVKF